LDECHKHVDVFSAGYVNIEIQAGIYFYANADIRINSIAHFDRHCYVYSNFEAHFLRHCHAYINSHLDFHIHRNLNAHLYGHCHIDRFGFPNGDDDTFADSHFHRNSYQYA
jgi:hypothetical protein